MPPACPAGVRVGSLRNDAPDSRFRQQAAASRSASPLAEQAGYVARSLRERIGDREANGGGWQSFSRA